MTDRITVSKEVLDFLTGIHTDRANHARRLEEIFNRAFEFAYKDISTHTIEYRGKSESDSAWNTYISQNSILCQENKKKIRAAIRNYVKCHIFGDDLCLLKDVMQNERFHAWHKTACETFVSMDCKVSELKKHKKEPETYTENLSSFFVLKDSSNKHIFTYGQAQKLINMMIKYLYKLWHMSPLTVMF